MNLNMSATVELNHRIVIEGLLHSKHQASEIIRDTGYALRTVYRIVRSNERQRYQRKVCNLRTYTIHSKSFLVFEPFICCKFIKTNCSGAKKAEY